MDNSIPDLRSVVRIDMGDENRSFSNDNFESALREAREYIIFYDWVDNIEEQYLGYAEDSIIYVFLFKIATSNPVVDSWLWVINGDIPPAYITCEDAKNPFEAIDAYIGAMEEWISAVREGKSIEQLIPVNAPPTIEYATALSNRLEFIDEKILPHIRNQTHKLH